MVDRKTRSLLCVPAHRPALYEKAARSGADVLMFDLEDSVPPQHKAEALETLAGYLSFGGKHLRQTVAVRINPSAGECCVLAKGRLDYIVIPKVERPTWHSVDQWEAPLLIVVETPAAIVHLQAIVEQEKVHGCIFGMADFAAGMGVSDRIGRPYNQRFAYAKQKLATYCAAYGKACFDTCFHVKGEGVEHAVYAAWEEARSWGYTGGAAIHPMQVRAANLAFSTEGLGPPTEKGWAEWTAEGHERRDGEVGVDESGLVVGMPVYRQAQAILEKGERP